MNFDRYCGMAAAVGIVLILMIFGWLGLWGPLETHLTPHVIGESIRVLSSIATGGAAVTGAFVAWRGLQKWREETIGKKRYELAAAVLADFYEADDIIRSSRGAFVAGQEIHEIIEGGIGDAVAANYAPEKRLLKHQEFFAHFRARKFEFAAYFGKAAASLFDELWKIRLEINWAVNDMVQNRDVRQSRRPEDRELWLSWSSVAFADPRKDKDPIQPRLEKIISNVEAICRPAIEAQIRTE